MASKWQVFGWPQNAGSGNLKAYPCFDTKEEAEEFMAVARREHPQLEFKAEECGHTEHRQ
jgi:hypothetical protein